MNEGLLQRLVCPRHGTSLHRRGADQLACDADCTFPVIGDVPVLLLPEAHETLWVAGQSLRSVADYDGGQELFVETLGVSEADRQQILKELAERTGGIDPVVSHLVVATSGNAYRHLKGRLPSYPIPELRLPDGKGQVFVDLGCNWGRWTIAAARKGYVSIGVDPSLGAVMAAKRVCRELGLEAHFVVADARYLPFADASSDVMFSYSVLQHMSRDDVVAVLAQVQRVLRPGGRSLIQMPLKSGVRCLYQQLRRGFRQPTGFEVRYWPLSELVRLFSSSVGTTEVSVDCYFGIGLQYSDLPLMRPWMRPVLRLSETLRRCSASIPALSRVADSVYLASTKGEAGPLRGDCRAR